MDSGLSADVTEFVKGLDSAMESHMAWTRRILRCTVLRVDPGGDVLHDDAHTLCSFGKWFTAHRDAFDAQIPDVAERISQAHKAMHDAIRAICRRAWVGERGQEAEIDAFEEAQAVLLRLLADVKTSVLTTTARLDPLTGLPMRYGIEYEFERCRQDALRRREQLVVVMLDIDHFKEVNDLHGHLAGDFALREFAAVLRAQVRRNEPLYRFGGEEFLVVLRTEAPGQIEAALHRLLEATRASEIILGSGQRLRLTATIGASLVHERDDFAAVVGRADAALYEGKRGGRNRFVLVDAWGAGTRP